MASKPITIVVPEGHSIYLRGRKFKAGDVISGDLVKLVPKEWKAKPAAPKSPGDNDK